MIQKKTRHKLPTWCDFLAICRCVCARCAFRILPRNTNGKFSCFFSSHLHNFISLLLLLSLFPLISFFIPFVELLMRNADVWETQTTTDVCRHNIFIIGNAFLTKKECVVFAAVYICEWKKAAQVNLLKMFIPIHLSGAMLRFYHHRCVTAIFFPYFILLFLRLVLLFFRCSIGKDKRTISSLSIRSVVYFFIFVFNAFVNKCTLSHTHTMCSKWQLYVPFISISFFLWCGFFFFFFLIITTILKTTTTKKKKENEKKSQHHVLFDVVNNVKR